MLTLDPNRNPAVHQMRQTALRERLAAAQRKAKLGQDLVDRQTMVVATLFAAGEETTEAENRLRVLQKHENDYIADVKRILDALERAMPDDPVMAVEKKDDRETRLQAAIEEISREAWRAEQTLPGLRRTIALILRDLGLENVGRPRHHSQTEWPHSERTRISG